MVVITIAEISLEILYRMERLRFFFLIKYVVLYVIIVLIALFDQRKESQYAENTYND